MDIGDLFNHLHLAEVDEGSYCAAAFRDVLASKAQEQAEQGDGSLTLPMGTIIGALIATFDSIEKRITAVENELAERAE